MDRSILFLCLCVAVEGEVGKHVYNKDRKNWTNAQSHCRNDKGVLSFITSQRDQDNLIKAAGDNNVAGWIGLHRDPNNIAVWKWSGGGALTYDNWAAHQPDNYKGIEFAGELWGSGKWNDASPDLPKPFYCFRINLVEERKTWEEALEHCQKQRTQLASVTSHTERVHAQTTIRRYSSSDPVWIGLRYLNDRWHWMNDDPMDYVDWPQGHEHQCPMLKRCGALTKTSGWVNWDCGDKLNFICI